MIAEQYYFHDKYSKMCFTEDYFQDLMKNEGLTKIEVIKAIPNRLEDSYFCKKYETFGEKSDNVCGKFCKGYLPKNGISGCCKHRSTKSFIHNNEKVVLTLLAK